MAKKIKQKKCKTHNWETKNPGPRAAVQRDWILERQCSECNQLEYGYRSNPSEEIVWQR